MSPPRDFLVRLSALDRTNPPPLDKARVEEAFARWFVALGRKPRPVTWVRDAEEGFRRVKTSSLGELAVDHRVGGARRAWIPSERAAAAVAFAATRSRPADGPLDWDDFGEPRSAGLEALRSITPRPEPALSPFLDAYEAGLWIYWVQPRYVVAVPRPILRLRAESLHAENGPAVEWADGGVRYWFWRGIQVPRHVIEEPDLILAADIPEERNVERRRVLIERLGAERLAREGGMELVHSDDFGSLYRLRLRRDEPVALVRVVNSTPEPDGSRKDYYLWVPPTLRSARDAVAWTFGMSGPEYRPSIET